MLARRQIPDDYRRWNEKWGAPFGRRGRKLRMFSALLPENLSLKMAGPFSVQPNNTIREFEYPWAYFAASVEPGMRVLDLGGGLGGFQFVLSKSGCRVVNVDPGLDAIGVGWDCSPEGIARLNRAFGTDVDLRNTILEDADIEPGSLDVIFSISVLEHFHRDEVYPAAQLANRLLKPGGAFVLTVDLFLNLNPFSNRCENRFGRNINIFELVEKSGLTLEQGEASELFGFAEFDHKEIMGRLAEFYIGTYPAMAQCVVLRKPN